MEWLDNLTARQRVELASFGTGGVLLVVAIILYTNGMRPLGGSLFVAGMVIAALPYALYIYFEDKKYGEMEDEFPSFVRSLSESIKSGMSLPQAFQQAARTDYGRLDEEVRRSSHQLSWGIPFPEVMDRMATRIHGSGLIRRAVYIILQSYESGGDISETLDAIAANAARIKEAEKEKKAVLMQQVYIIYAIYFLFLGIVLALFTLLDSFLLGMGSSSGGSAFGFGQVQNFCDVSAVAKPICTLCSVFGLGTPADKLCYYKGLFLIMIVVGGVFNGLVAGEILDGKVSSGVKHALIMAPLGLILYIVAVTAVLPAL